jgi:hypothetical protein
MEKEIAVRLFENKKLGTTYGRGLYRTAVFNASAEIKDPHVKYLLDFYQYDRWQHTATTDNQITVLNQINESCSADDLTSWITRYNSATKEKTLVDGVAIFDSKTNTLRVVVSDPESGIEDSWVLPVKACSVTRTNSPSLIATNTELASW